jgi:hypothetical protein
MRHAYRTTLVAAACVAGSLALPAPAHASTRLSVEGQWVCNNIAPGNRTIIWDVTNHLTSPATVTAISASPPVWYLPSVGDTLAVGQNINGSGRTDSGPTTATFSITVHWEDADGPHDETAGGRITMGLCLSKPAATLTVVCGGPVRVTMTDGDNTGFDASGSVFFQISGTNGFYQDNIGVNAGTSGWIDVPAANAGHVVVTSDGKVVAEGGNASGTCAPPQSTTPAARPTRATTVGGAPALAAGTGDSAGQTVGPTPSASTPASAGTASPTPSTTTAPQPVVAAHRSGSGPSISWLVPIAVLFLGTGAVLWLRRRRGTAPDAGVSPEPSE